MKSWSLRVERAGADPSVIDEIVGSLSNEIYDGILTFELYRIVFSKLRNQRTGVAGRYNLKQAIMQLGPTGFPFQRLIAALFESDGFCTKVGEIVRGKCVSHEVDVIAEKAELHHLAECKFHSFRGKVCDVKHALYMHARFVDLEKRFLAEPAHSHKTHKGWLITNTKDDIGRNRIWNVRRPRSFELGLSGGEEPAGMDRQRGFASGDVPDFVVGETETTVAQERCGSVPGIDGEPARPG